MQRQLLSFSQRNDFWTRRYRTSYKIRLWSRVEHIQSFNIINIKATEILLWLKSNFSKYERMSYRMIQHWCNKLWLVWNRLNRKIAIKSIWTGRKLLVTLESMAVHPLSSWPFELIYTHNWSTFIVSNY